MNALKKLSLVAIATLLVACNPETGNQADAHSQPAGNTLADTRAPEGRDWSKVVSSTADGYLMGNPNAQVKLIEYASFSCPHCGDFYRKGFESLKSNYIATGLVQFEFRAFLLGAVDVPISLLAYCQNPEGFFAVEHGLFQEQDAWIGKLQASPRAELERLGSLPPEQANQELIRLTGLDQFFRVRGLPSAKQAQCLKDEAMIARLTRVRNDGIQKHQVQGTPAFILNGTTLGGVATWPALETALREALGR